MKLRIIIPIHKNEDPIYVNSILEHNKNASVYKWKEITFHQINGDFNSRADAMNYGFNKYCRKSDYVMFLHCDTKLPIDYSKRLYYFFKSKYETPFCFFRLSFDTTEQLVSPKLIEYIVNNSRKEPYGDQCFAMSCSLFTNNGMFPSLLLLEDVVFYRKIQQRYGLIYEDHALQASVITSDRRFRYKGTHITEETFLRNVCNNRIIILLHKIGVSPDALGRWYYRNDLHGSLN
jgi:hypothetical protein